MTTRQPAEPADLARRAALVGTLGYLIASVLWGMNLPLSAALLQHFDPFWVSPLRYAVATVLLGGLLVASRGVRQLRSPIPLWRIAVLSLCVASFLVLYNLGLYRTHPMTVAALSAGSPVYVAVVSRLMTGARLERGFWGATALTLVGAGIAVQGRARAGGGVGGGDDDDAATGMVQFLQGGELLVVLAICSWTAYSILAQRWFAPETPQLRRTYLTTIGALPWLLLFWVGARASGLVGPPNLQPAAGPVLQLLVAAVFCTALATVAWNTGVNRLGIQTGGLWQNMVPVFAVLISLLFFGVQPLPEQLIGGAVVLAGVLYMQWQRARSARAEAAPPPR
ncbi:MAG: DMT family transporter [Microbacteriaceae bacterium]|nr:DMT family transporter [Burkholderiaceae bacterium]